MTAITWFFVNPLGRKVGIGILAALLLTGVYLKIRHDGKEAGKVEQKDSQKLDIESSREADRTRTGVAVDDKSAEIADAKRQAKVATDAARQTNALLVALLNDRKQAAAATAALDDAKLHPANAKLLGEPEGQACYSSKAERQINTALTQFPLCEQQVGKFEQKDKEREDSVAQLNRQIGALEERDRIKDELRARDDERWKQLWNLNPPKVRAWGCLKAWKCGKKKLPEVK